MISVVIVTGAYNVVYSTVLSRETESDRPPMSDGHAAATEAGQVQRAWTQAVAEELPSTGKHAVRTRVAESLELARTPGGMSIAASP